MEALGVLATLTAAVAVLVVPGLPTVLVLRLRPLAASTFVVPVSLFLVTIAAELGHLAGIPWTGLSPLLLGLVLGLALVPLGRRRTRAGMGCSRPELPGAAASGVADPTGQALRSPRGHAAVILGGLVIGGGVILAQALTMMGEIHAVSQTFDNVFHLNAVRHILRHADGSAWVVGGMTTLPGSETYYPALWHQAVSLVVQLSGQEIALASNLMMLLLAAVVWPLGLMMLVRSSTSAGPIGWFAAGALAGVTGAFPLSLMSWGILLPYLLSMTMMPLVLVLIAQVSGVPSGPRERLAPVQLLALTPATCTVILLAHPQGMFVAVLLGLPILAWMTAVRAGDLLAGRPRAAARFWALALPTAAVLIALPFAWTELRPSPGSAIWAPNASPVQALGQAVSLAPNASPAWFPLGVVVLGCMLAVLLGSRSRWLLGPWLIAVAMSVITRAVPEGDLRYLLTGIWYTDNYRVTTLIAVASVPVLAVGIEVLLLRLLDALPPLRVTATAALAVLMTSSLLALSALSPGTRVNREHLLANWQGDALLSADERELLERLPTVVPESSVVATNALNGSSLVYAISDRTPLNIYMKFQAEPEVHLLNAELDEANSDPEVCDAVESLGVDYALDFGPREVNDGWATYTGLNEISETGAAEVVLQVGEAKLLRMLPCRGTDGSMKL